MTSIDLNSDLGESFGAWTMGDDAAMFRLVTSANIACGFHAGDASTMLTSARRAVAEGVVIGAHPSYRDLAGFGRRALDVEPAELHAEVLYQVSALRGLAESAGGAVAYLKPHGALYTRIAVDERQAEAVASAAADAGLPLLGMPGSVIERVARARGLTFVREGYADRAYRADGTLVPRGRPDAVLHDPEAVAARAVRMVVDGTVETVDGTTLPLELDSLCVHGDTPGAVALAAATRAALAAAGVEVAPWHRP